MHGAASDVENAQSGWSVTMEPKDKSRSEPDGNRYGKAPECDRCGGLLVLTFYQDLQDDTGQIDIAALRCTMCGEVIDPLILENRRSPPPNLLYGTKQRNYGQRIIAIDSTSKKPPDAENEENPESEGP